MGITAHSLDDGEGRYASRTRCNRLVYDFVAGDLTDLTTKSVTVNLNGKVHRIIVDPTNSVIADGTSTTGVFELIDDLGYPYHSAISALDFSIDSTAVYQFQTSEGAATADGTHNDSNHLVVFSGKSHDGVLPKTLNGAGTATVMDDTAPWTGLVCGPVTIRLTSTAKAWTSAATIRIVIYYE
tara:strand:+ start:2521 stop:3069 length:549 start_codon:yes stop_codon:yes gene_type:complete